VIEIKKTAEERRNRKSKAANEKRNVNDGFVSVFCRNSDPTANPPRTEFLRRKNSDGYKVEKVGFRNNRHVVGYLRKATGCWDRWEESLRQMNSESSAWAPSQSCWRAERKQYRKRAEKIWMQKSKTRAQNAKACDSAVHMGFSRARRHF
jgi:hypothetical protein